MGGVRETCGKTVSEHEKSLTWPFCGLPAGGGVFGTIEDVISGTPFWDAAVQMDFMDVMIMYARLFDEVLAAELTRRLSYGILFQKSKQNQPLPALRQ